MLDQIYHNYILNLGWHLFNHKLVEMNIDC